MGGHRDHRSTATASLQEAKLACGFVAILLRHLAIHQDGGVAALLECLERLAAIPDGLSPVAASLEHANGQNLVDVIVLGHQD